MLVDCQCTAYHNIANTVKYYYYLHQPGLWHHITALRLLALAGQATIKDCHCQLFCSSLCTVSFEDGTNTAQAHVAIIIRILFQLLIFFFFWHICYITFVLNTYVLLIYHMFLTYYMFLTKEDKTALNPTYQPYKLTILKVHSFVHFRFDRVFYNEFWNILQINDTPLPITSSQPIIYHRLKLI